MKKLAGCFLFLLSISLHAQVHLGNVPPNGGGEYQFQAHDEMSPAQRQAVIQMLEANVQMLKQSGVQLKQNPSQFIAFAWPLRKAAGFTDNGYYGISNYVDKSTSPPGVLDYNCGTRTYSGHKGTDIFTWPFGWNKMATNAIEVIASAPGMIIGKADGFSDQSCAMCSTCPWNAVYVQHSDGSIAWYGHLKTGSVTTKPVGDPVVTGEYLGIVGSSGNSTGPHLHLEITLNNVKIDPWNGSCNANVSWWANQEPYRVSTLNTLMTHSAPPQTGNCPSQEVMNQKSVFAPGETMYLGSYYRDQQPGQSAVHRIYYPDNSLWMTWNQSFTSTFTASYWYYTRVLPASGNINGTWRYEVTYESQVVSTNFTVGAAPAPDLAISNQSVLPTSTPAGGTVTVTYTVTNGGNGGAGNHKTSFYLSPDILLTPGMNGDILLGEQDIPPIAAGANGGILVKQLTIPCSITTGSYSLFAVADGGSLIAESNETNNVVLSPLSVSAACTATSIAAIEGLEHFSFSPNPSNGLIIIDLRLNRPRQVSILVTDGVGRQVFKSSSKIISGSNNQSVDFEKLAAGIYYLNVQIGNQVLVEKLIKQK